MADLLEGGPGALTASKQLLAQVPTMDLDTAFEWTAKLSAELFDSDEAQHGMTSYLAKTPPRWSPRV